MNIFKKYFLWLLVLLAFSPCHETLFAGPIYAAHWHKNGHDVILYGDMHKDSFIADDLRADMLNVGLKKYNGRSTLLVEDWYRNLVSADDRISELLIERNQTNRDQPGRFLQLTCGKYFKQYAQNKVGLVNIDLRRDLSCLKLLCTALHLLQEPIDDDQKEEILTWIQELQDLIGDMPIANLMHSPCAWLEVFIEQTNNQQLQDTFKTIHNNIHKRNSFFWKTLHRKGFSIEELGQLSLHTLIKVMTGKSNDEKLKEQYSLLCNIFRSDRIMAYHALEIVEACAIRSIDKAAQDDAAVIVAAGLLHLINLEDYLVAHGYKKIKTDNADFFEDLKKIYTNTPWANDNYLRSSHFFAIALNDEVRNETSNSPLKSTEQEFDRLTESASLISLASLDWLPENDELEMMNFNAQDFLKYALEHTDDAFESLI